MSSNSKWSKCCQIKYYASQHIYI